MAGKSKSSLSLSLLGSFKMRSRRGNKKELDEPAVEYEVTTAIVQNQRESQQDRIRIADDKRFLVVLDGHGDLDNVVDFCADNVLGYHAEHLKATNCRKEAPSKTIAQLNKEVKAKKFQQGGTVLVTVSITETEIIVHNLGDCRAVLGIYNGNVPLSWDHKPNRPIEKKRIIAKGGEVTWDNFISAKEVGSQVNFSRSIGDLELSKYISREPEIHVRNRRKGDDDFIILASDGLWGVLSTEYVVSYIYRELDNGQTHDEITTSLINKAARKGTDNISIIIIWFNKNVQEYL